MNQISKIEKAELKLFKQEVNTKYGHFQKCKFLSNPQSRLIDPEDTA